MRKRQYWGLAHGLYNFKAFISQIARKMKVQLQIHTHGCWSKIFKASYYAGYELSTWEAEKINSLVPAQQEPIARIRKAQK